MTTLPPFPSPGPTSRRLRLLFWLLLATISLPAFLATVQDVQLTPGTDLRARIVGARALLLGKDPYFTPAKTNTDQSLQDPDRYAADFTRCTYTPTLLCVYMPLSHLSYRTQRFIWFAIEWLALAASIALLRSLFPTRKTQNIFTAAAILFFADSIFWRLHLERGQYYVFILFLFTLTARLCITKKSPNQSPTPTDRLWHGLPLGIAAALRLTPLAALPPLWTAGYRRTTIGAAATFLACITAILPLAGPKTWQNYFRIVSLQSRMVTDRDFARAEHAKLPPLPSTVEGTPFTQKIDLPNVNVNFTMDILRLLSERYSWIPTRDHWDLTSHIAAALVCLIFTLILWRSPLSPEEKLAAAFLCALSMDFFLPTRISYADILFLAPLGLVAPAILRQRTAYLWLTALLIALTLCNGFYPKQFPASALRPLLLMTVLIEYLAFRRTYRPAPTPTHPTPFTNFQAQPA